MSESSPNGSNPPNAAAPGDQPWRNSVWTAAAFWLTANVPVCIGVLLGFQTLQPGRPIPYGEDSLLQRFCAWDGGQFMHILNSGYHYDSESISNVALFPGYPSVTALLQSATGLSTPLALLIVSQVSLFLGLIIWHRYISLRFPDHPQLPNWVLAAVVFFPPSFFFRMAYSESLFLLLSALVLLALESRWPKVLSALLIGAAVGVRLVGIAFIPVFLLHLFTDAGGRRKQFTAAMLCLPLCIWGLLAYMAFLNQRFEDPFVFSKAQDNFYLRPPVSTTDHWYRLATLEPIFANYQSDSLAYWRRHDPDLPAMFSLQFANPFWFLTLVVATLYGWIRHVLNDKEFLLSATLLALAYVGRAEEFCMGSQARYSLAALPAFITIGKVCGGLPKPIRLTLVTGGISLLTAYSALFAAWYFLL